MEEDPRDNRYTMLDVAIICLSRTRTHNISIQFLELLAATPKYITYYDLAAFGDNLYNLFVEDRRRYLQDKCLLGVWESYRRLTAVIIDKSYISYDIYKMALNIARQIDTQNIAAISDTYAKLPNEISALTLDHIGVE